MNKTDEHFDAAQPVDSLMIMRLVDDELSAEERRQVLTALEAQPGGWRSCALAFLEDQVLKRELASTREARVPTTPPRSPVVSSKGKTGHPAPRQTRNSDAMSWQSLLGIAATIQFAFAVGWIGSQGSQGIGGDVSPSPNAIASQPRVGADQAWQNGATAGQPTTLATYPVPDRSFWEQESVIPVEVRQALKDKGTQVRRQRGLMPYWLPDGRRVTVPYEDVQLVPVNRVSH
ncbi:MAG: hypothetical protein AAF497_23670 [Planctomycetota bacterium]